MRGSKEWQKWQEGLLIKLKKLKRLMNREAKMKAAVLEEVKKIKIKEIPIPKISKDEVLVKVKACGICQTDYSAYMGFRMN